MDDAIVESEARRTGIFVLLSKWRFIWYGVLCARINLGRVISQFYRRSFDTMLWRLDSEDFQGFVDPCMVSRLSQPPGCIVVVTVTVIASVINPS